ncbi:MAG: hypothetical protein WC520_02415 [Candidatus Paceibacterota bacterium]
MEKNPNDFVNFGTYGYLDYNVLKQEFEKQKIPVKTNLAGTSLGTDALGGAQWSAYTIFVPLKCFPIATEIALSFNLTPASNPEEDRSQNSKPTFWSRMKRYGAIAFFIGSLFNFILSLSSLFSIAKTLGPSYAQIEIYFILFYFTIFVASALILYKTLRKDPKK